MSGQNDTEFTRVLRGYDPDQVDKVFQELNRELLLTKNNLSTALDEITSLNKRVKIAETDLAELGKPSYAGLGAKLEHTLRTAEEYAQKLVTEANTKAEQIVFSAQEEARLLTESANQNYQERLVEAESKAQTVTTELISQAQNTLNQAVIKAEIVTEDALREAASIRGAVATEAAQIRATAKRESAEALAETERTCAELKVIATRTAAEGLDPIQLLTDQIRQDLEMELAARRDEAEKEFLLRHQEAVAQTQKYLDEANTLLAETIRRVNDKGLVADTTEAQALSEAKKIIETAEAEAAKVKTEAAQSRELQLKSAKIEAENIIAAAEEQLKTLRNQKQAVELYFSGLKNLIVQAAPDN